MSNLEITLAVTSTVFGLAFLYSYFTTPTKIKRAKLETFSGMLNVLTFGLAPHDFEKRWDRLAFSLSSFLGIEDAQAAKWRLLRASFYRYFRPNPALVDVMNERGRLVIIEQVSGDETAERLWGFFENVLEGEEEREPKDVFSEDELARAQLELEAQLIDFYRSKLSKVK